MIGKGATHRGSPKDDKEAAYLMRGGVSYSGKAVFCLHVRLGRIVHF
jgi:hypothetical protein